MTPLRVGFIGYEQANALDLAAEAFASAFRDSGKGKPERCYEIVIIGLTKRPFVTVSPNALFVRTASFTRRREEQRESICPAMIEQDLGSKIALAPARNGG